MQEFQVIIGAVLGGLAAWLFARLKYSGGIDPAAAEQLKKDKDQLMIEKSRAEEAAAMLKANLDKAEGEAASERAEIRRLESDLAAKKAELSAAADKWAEKQAEFESFTTKMTSEFENTANRILDEKTRKFSEQGQQGLLALLSPFKDKLSSFEARVNQMHTDEARQSATLMEQIRALTELNNRVTQDTKNLTDALKGKAKFQGTWGEMLLQETLESMGLKEQEHFLVQKKFMEAGAEKEDLQPDIVVKMPSKRDVVVDSKVNLTAYSEYFNTSDEAARAAAAGRHLEAVENHIKGLSEKDYQGIHQLNTLDFVLMFMPLEAAYLLALEESAKRGRNLLQFALSKKIMIVTPSTILPVFRTVAHIWEQDKQTKNVMEIARQAGALYDKFVGFVEDFRGVARSLEGAQRSCGDAMNKLTEGSGNIVKRFEDLKALGAKAKKALPPEMAQKGIEVEAPQN